jgi:ADP-heptose:LPS heptosyltransferase
MRLGWSALPNALLYPVFVRRRTPKRPGKRAAIIKLGKLGDSVLALGAIRSLLDQFGPENCTIISSPFARDLIASVFPSVEVLTVTTNHSTLRRTLVDLYRHRSHPVFRKGVDELVSLQHHRTLHDDLITSAIPARRAWGLANSELGAAGLRDQLVNSSLRFDNITPVPPQDRAICRELSLHGALVSEVLGRKVSAESLRPQIRSEAAAPQPVLGLAPFSGSVLRDIPLRLLEGACRSAQALGYEVHVWAPSREDARTVALVEHLRNATPALVRIVQTPTTSDLVLAISTSQLVVAAESAPAHIATALNRPLVAILGGGHFGWFAPWVSSRRQQWLYAPQVCFSCNWNCVHAEPICITRIRDEDFQKAISTVLEEAPRELSMNPGESVVR